MLTFLKRSDELQVSKVGDIVIVDQKVLFLIATKPRNKGGRYSFPWIDPLTLVSYVIMLSVKQEGI